MRSIVVAKKIGIEENKFTEILNSSTKIILLRKLKQFILNRAFNSGFAFFNGQRCWYRQIRSEANGMSLELLDAVSKYLNYSVKSFEEDLIIQNL